MADYYVRMGALQFGVLMSTFLFGASTIQVYSYFGRFAKDRLLIKLMVCGVWAFELAHTIAITFALMATSRLQIESPELIPTSELHYGFRIAIFFSGAVATLVQAYYTERLRILTENNLLITIIFYVMALFRLAGWIVVTAVVMYTNVPLTKLDLELGMQWPFAPLLIVGALIDLSLSFLIFYYFKRSREILEKGPKFFNKLSRWTIQNGLLTGLAGILTSIFLLSMRDNFVWVASFMVLTRLFSLSFMASLNARERLRKHWYHHLEAGEQSKLQQAAELAKPVSLPPPPSGKVLTSPPTIRSKAATIKSVKSAKSKKSKKSYTYARDSSYAQLIRRSSDGNIVDGTDEDRPTSPILAPPTPPTPSTPTLPETTTVSALMLSRQSPLQTLQNDPTFLEFSHYQFDTPLPSIPMDLSSPSMQFPASFISPSPRFHPLPLPPTPTPRIRNLPLPFVSPSRGMVESSPNRSLRSLPVPPITTNVTPTSSAPLSAFVNQ